MTLVIAKGIELLDERKGSGVAAAKGTSVTVVGAPMLVTVLQGFDSPARERRASRENACPARVCVVKHNTKRAGACLCERV